MKRGDSNAVRVAMKINVEENTNKDDTKISDVHKEYVRAKPYGGVERGL